MSRIRAARLSGTFTRCALQRSHQCRNSHSFERICELAQSLLYFIQSETIFRGLWLKGDFMRKTALALIAIAGVAAICASPAQAFSTCSSAHGWCGPSESNKGTTRDGSPGSGGTTTSTSVPEPGTLVLLAAGVTAIGGAALRRKRAAKKDK
jgi:PEP-CTERM motif